MQTDFLEDRYIRLLQIDWEKIDRSSYLRQIEALKNISELAFQKNITFFVGENGSGKSTLLEAIAKAYGFNPEGGTLNYHFSTYEDTSELFQAIQLVKGFQRPKTGYFFRAESFFNVATAAVEEYESNNNYHTQSHGESFLSFLGGFQGNGIYLMDEPEAALSPQRQLSLLLHIHNLAKRGSQFIIVTHSPILLGTPNADIWTFDEGEIHTCQYEETESYQITKMFLENKEEVLKRLLEE
ncbi:MAG: AAA family ATPase [Lachnospiraceae bacterium]|nr:AAA family ATPase [Lachnospiraceae bacterium]